MSKGTRSDEKEVVYASVCLIRYLYKQGQISEKQYNAVVKKYGSAA